MIREAVDDRDAFDNCRLSVYANNTNVRADSDVDITVQCHEVEYWEEASKGTHLPGPPYSSIWTPSKFRYELEWALRSKFPYQVDASGSTSLQVNSSSARVDADVVPCFNYRYYYSGGSREGTRIFTKSGQSFENCPVQHLENGKVKNSRTNTRFKKAVRILKRTENAMVAAGAHREVQSYFVECLVYNCPDAALTLSTWTDVGIPFTQVPTTGCGGVSSSDHGYP